MLRRAAVFSLLLGLAMVLPGAEPPRPRARDIGLAPGTYPTGPENAITDVSGVQVGHVTVRLGDDVRTGVTAILPHGGDLYRQKVPAAIEVQNGYGKLIGFTQVRELGQIETPILLTNTLAVWDAAATMVRYLLAQPGNEEIRSLNPVVGETNDGRLNDIRGRHLEEDHFLNAIRWASDGPVGEGSVGAGTGTVAFGYKGGIGTSSRRLRREDGGYTVGVLVQSNFGGNLTVGGQPVWRLLAGSGGGAEARADAGSCMIVIATDAPLTSRQLGRLARRSFAGMARTGASFSHGSGDYAIAFSAATEVRIPHEGSAGLRRPLIVDSSLSPLFEAVAEATEEAILNSLLQARRVCGIGGFCVDPLPIDALRRVLGTEPPPEPAAPDGPPSGPQEPAEPGAPGPPGAGEPEGP